MQTYEVKYLHTIYNIQPCNTTGIKVLTAPFCLKWEVYQKTSVSVGRTVHLLTFIRAPVVTLYQSPKVLAVKALKSLTVVRRFNENKF